jgi:hypothetical protein
MNRIPPVLFVLAALILAAPALANEPPEISSPSEIQRDPGQLILFNVSTSDPDGDVVTLSAANVPAGARFTADGNGFGSFIWSTPQPEDEGFYLVTLIATDDGSPRLTTTADVAITVGDPNLPPELDPIGDQEATEGMVLVVPLSAMDPEGDPLVFSTDPVLAGSFMQVGPDGTATFEYTPGPAAVGNQVVTFVVSDGLSTDEETIVITVGQANVPPVLSPIGDRQADVGGLLDIVLEATDVDGDLLAFFASGLPEGVALSDAGDGTAQLTGTPSVAGIYTVTVTVTDDGEPPEAAAETFEVDVQALPEETTLVLLEAQWTHRRLEVVGEGALPGAPVDFHDPATGAGLGTTTADAHGIFMATLRPFVTPCSIQASSDGETSAALPIENAPASCGEGPHTRILAASWKCRRGSLYVVGKRAPANGIVRFYDAESDALLGTTSANRRGHFLLRTTPAERPERIQASVESGGVEWILDPVAVRSTGPCADRNEHHGNHHSGWDRKHRGRDHRDCHSGDRDQHDGDHHDGHGHRGRHRD